MLKIKRFVNELMASNCYLIEDDASKHCLCIDPASEKSEQEVSYIESEGLSLDYILLTHEHTDHTWGVNALVEKYPKVKVICSSVCKQNLAKEFQAYFLLYYDNVDYHYNVCRVDITTEELNGILEWFGHIIVFVSTPGHSRGSICINVDGYLFSGDTILQAKPYINRRNGSKELFWESIKKIRTEYKDDTLIYPGHGEAFLFKDYGY